MTRYLTYVGSRSVKVVPREHGNHFTFPRGQKVDTAAIKMRPEQVDELAGSRLFVLSGGATTPVKPKLNPPRKICGCGYVAPSEDILAEHRRRCDAG